MIVSTYHTHTTFSDGKNTAREMVESAIACGMKEIGFSDHAPMIFETSWAMPQGRVNSYKKTILELKEEYKDRIKIYLGIEQDYYSTPAEGYDFIIGSVHFVSKNGVYLPVDLSAEETMRFVNEHYNGDGYAYAEDYFELIKDIYNKTKCHIIGHFDIVTKFNERLPIVDINNERYVKAYKSALDELLKTPAIFEINTGAISRGYRKGPYPDDNMLDIIGKSGKPFAICSDTHNVDTVAFDLEKERERLDLKGYSYIKSLEEII